MEFLNLISNQRIYKKYSALTLFSGLLLMTIPQWGLGQQLHNDSGNLINKIQMKRAQIDEFMARRLNVKTSEITSIVNGSIYVQNHDEHIEIPENTYNRYLQNGKSKNKRKLVPEPLVVETSDSSMQLHFHSENYKVFDKPTLFIAQIVDRNWFFEMMKLVGENIGAVSFQECFPQALKVASAIIEDSKSISYEEFYAFGNELKALRDLLYQAQYQLSSKTDERPLLISKLVKTLKENNEFLNSTRIIITQLKTDILSLDRPSNHQNCQNITSKEVFPYRQSQETFLSQIDAISFSSNP